MASLEYILLSDCRCGGTALRKMLIERGLDLPDDEPLLAAWEDRSLDPWGQLTHKGAHVQRYQIADLDLWEQFAALPIRIISLTRTDTLAQYVSWVNAVHTDIWHDHPRKRFLQVPFDHAQYNEVSTGWREGRAYALKVFGHLPTLHVTYEEFEADNAGVADRCAAFLLGHTL